MILPMAGHKGYAISFLMDVLSGALTGSAVGTGVHGPYEADRPSGAGHLFLALDPDAFGDRAGYESRVRQLIDEVKDVPLAQGFDEVFYPGEVEDRAEAANLAAGGVLLAEQSLADLRELAAATGVPLPVDEVGLARLGEVGGGGHAASSGSGTPVAAASSRRSVSDCSARSTPPAARFAASARSSTSPG